MFRVQPLVYLKGPLPGSLPPTVLPIILLPCLKGPVGLMISYRLVDILTQREDEWRGPAPTPDTHTYTQQIEDEGGALPPRVPGGGLLQGRPFRNITRSLSWDPPIAFIKVVAMSRINSLRPLFSKSPGFWKARNLGVHKGRPFLR